MTNNPRLKRVLLIAVTLLLTNCDAGPPEAVAAAPEKPSLFVAVARGRVDIEGGLVKLAAKRDGVVRSVLVEEGGYVKKGQVLLVLDDEQAKLSADLARAELEQASTTIPVLDVKLAAAKREVQRLTPLVASKLVAQRELDLMQDQARQLENELKSAQASVVTAQKRLKVAEFEIEQRIVRAPADGQIVKRTAREGDGVSTLNVTQLFLFSPSVDKIVRAELEEQFLTLIKVNQAAEVIIEANDKQHFPATLKRIGLVVGQRTPTEDVNEKQDNKIVECVLTLNAPELLIGQRVLVRFKK
ncbi:MAG: HlyD family secretion protein [Gammaproteobacteria bacterium]